MLYRYDYIFNFQLLLPYWITPIYSCTSDNLGMTWPSVHLYQHQLTATSPPPSSHPHTSSSASSAHFSRTSMASLLSGLKNSWPLYSWVALRLYSPTLNTAGQRAWSLIDSLGNTCGWYYRKVDLNSEGKIRPLLTIGRTTSRTVNTMKGSRIVHLHLIHSLHVHRPRTHITQL